MFSKFNRRLQENAGYCDLGLFLNFLISLDFTRMACNKPCQKELELFGFKHILFKG